MISPLTRNLIDEDIDRRSESPLASSKIRQGVGTRLYNERSNTMSVSTLAFEKETLRNLAGPELYMQTSLEPLDGGAMEEINGGSILSAIASATGSAISSAW